MSFNLESVNLFPPIIWKFSYEFDWSVLEPKITKLFSLVEKNSDLESGDALSTVSVSQGLQPHTWKELEHFQITLGGAINEIRIQNDFVNVHSEVTQSWCNIHRYGGETLEHCHNYSTFVASCYVRCPDKSGNIVFKDPLEYHKSNYPIIPETYFFKEVPVKTNDVLIFPGWLKHRVNPSKSREDRYVITFNIK